MGKRSKIISEIERHVSRLKDRPGLCLHYAPPYGGDIVATWL